MDTLIFIIIGLSLSTTLLLAWLAETLSKRWLVTIVVPFLCIVSFYSWDGVEELKGRPTTVLPDGDFEVLDAIPNPPNVEWLLIRKLGGNFRPIYLEINRTKKNSKQIQSLEEALREGKQRMIRRPSRGESDGSDSNGEFMDYDLNGEDLHRK